MQIYVVSREGKTLRLGLKNHSTTIIEPLIQELNQNEDVEYCRYIGDHPDLDDPYLEVRVRNGTPEEALKKASAAVGEYFSSISE